MTTQKKRWLIGTCVLAALLLAVPAEGQAACALLDWLSGGSNAQSTYVPPYAAPVAYVPATAATSSCTPCATQTVQYVPQTYYRAAYVAVPVTAYRPTVTADPCTGCAVTAYRPVTTVTYQTRLVPYTSYRVVYANPAPCASYSYAPCSPCGPTSYVSPSSSCGPCAGGTSTAPYTDQPVTPADRTPTLGVTPPTTLTPKADASSNTPDSVPSRTFNDDRDTSKPPERYRDDSRLERPSSAPATIGPDIVPGEGRTTQRVAPAATPVGMSSSLRPLVPVEKSAVIEAAWQPVID
jgi:hypothetical protein